MCDCRGVDLLLVDSGDRVDGNGLVDAEPSAHPKGYTALSLFAQMPYDVVTTGNHELYRYPVAKYTREVLSEKFGERWVVSNVNITLEDKRLEEDTEVLLGNRLRKFETEMGRKVTAFGPLFDFKGMLPTALRETRLELTLPLYAQLMRQVSPCRSRARWSRKNGSSKLFKMLPISSSSVRPIVLLA